jgi:hypothetical protein
MPLWKIVSRPPGPCERRDGAQLHAMNAGGRHMMHFVEMEFPGIVTSTSRAKWKITNSER